VAFTRHVLHRSGMLGQIRCASVLPRVFVWSLLVLASASGLSAQTAEHGESRPAASVGSYAPDSEAGFRAVAGDVEQEVPSAFLLVVGYGTLWLLLFLFIFRLTRTQFATRQRTLELEKALASVPPDGKS
jgi:hypothetical protein